MKHGKSLLSGILITVVLPVALIFSVIAGIVMMVVNQNIDQFSQIQNSLVLINIIGLFFIAGVIVLAMKKVSSRINSLAVVAKRLVDGDLEIDFESENFQDQLGEISAALFGIAENMRLQTKAAVQLAQGDLSTEIAPSSNKDALGNSLLEIQSSMKMVTDYLM